MGRYKDGGNSSPGTGTVEDVTGSVANGFEVVVANDPTVDPLLSVKLNPTLTNNDVVLADGSGGVKAATSTGTGNVVRATAPTVSSPVLNTAVSGTAVQDDDTFASPSSTKVASSSSIKNYVDNKVAGLSWKASVRVATTANGTLATAFANGQTVDGVVLATGDRILIKNQSTATQNGIYIVAASGAPTRSTDADTGAELVNATVLVQEGTVNAETQWTCSTNAPITIGVTNITFAAINVGTYSAGNGLTLTGNTFSIDTSIVVDKTTVQTLTNKTLTTPTITKPVMDATNPTAQAYTPASGSVTSTLDCSLGNQHDIALNTGGTTLTIALSNITNNQIILIGITQPASGTLGTIAAFPGTVRWVGGSTPSLTATLGKRDYFALRRTGSGTYDGFVVGQNL